jgi:hypothetical protein
VKHCVPHSKTATKHFHVSLTELAPSAIIYARLVRHFYRCRHHDGLARGKG